MINVVITGDRELLLKFTDRWPAAVHDAIVQKMYAAVAAIEAKTKENLSGPVLKVRTGRLRASIKSDVQDQGTAVTGTVGSYGVPYARIQEFGGTTGPHVILPVKAQVLAFMIGGKQVFARRVNHPGSKIPERSYLRSAFAERLSGIVAEFESVVTEAMRNAA